MNEADLGHLRRSIEISQAARSHGNHPFGALLVGSTGEILDEAENTVATQQDATGHAELNLVRLVSSRHSPDVLAESMLFTSTEPCAMCAGAIHWAGIGNVAYALSQEGLYSLMGPSAAVEALRIPCREVFARSGRHVHVEGPALEDEAKQPHVGFWEAL
jgi:tRNA(Arg) A34 adenosine deaminase TadA